MISRLVDTFILLSISIFYTMQTDISIQIFLFISNTFRLSSNLSVTPKFISNYEVLNRQASLSKDECQYDNLRAYTK